MAGKNLEQIKESVIEAYKKDFPGEALYNKVFSVYLLEKYAKLLYKLYKKADQKK